MFLFGFSQTRLFSLTHVNCASAGPPSSAKSLIDNSNWSMCRHFVATKMEEPPNSAKSRNIRKNVLQEKGISVPQEGVFKTFVSNTYGIPFLFFISLAARVPGYKPHKRSRNKIGHVCWPCKNVDVIIKPVSKCSMFYNLKRLRLKRSLVNAKQAFCLSAYL